MSCNVNCKLRSREWAPLDEHIRDVLMPIRFMFFDHLLLLGEVWKRSVTGSPPKACLHWVNLGIYQLKRKIGKSSRLHHTDTWPGPLTEWMSAEGWDGKALLFCPLGTTSSAWAWWCFSKSRPERPNKCRPPAASQPRIGSGRNMRFEWSLLVFSSRCCGASVSTKSYKLRTYLWRICTWFPSRDNGICRQKRARADRVFTIIWSFSVNVEAVGKCMQEMEMKRAIGHWKLGIVFAPRRERTMTTCNACQWPVLHTGLATISQHFPFRLVLKYVARQRYLHRVGQIYADETCTSLHFKYLPS